MLESIPSSTEYQLGTPSFVVLFDLGFTYMTMVRNVSNVPLKSPPDISRRC